VELHASATAFANYALCMAGPTGPQLLRDNPDEYRKLVRRRLVSAQPEERPFAACMRAAGELGQTGRSVQAHQVEAAHFVEYGLDATERARTSTREISLNDLRVSSRRLAELYDASWPFAREGYTALVKPSLGAHEAAHPIALPAPGFGRGLPDRADRYRSAKRTREGVLVALGSGANQLALESRDGGTTFTAIAPRRASDIAGRCVSGATSFTFGVSEDGRAHQVVSAAEGAEARVTPLTSTDDNIFTASCDVGTLVVGVEHEATRARRAFLCRLGGACAPLALPKLGATAIDGRFEIDLARVEGATVLSLARNGVVRVTSSRDDGQSWTPFGVAYDVGSEPLLRSLPVPDRLLTLGARVVLYAGGADASRAYPLLMSDDYGATWRTPRDGGRAVAAAQ
jgi:hypothetical protein